MSGEIVLVEYSFHVSTDTQKVGRFYPTGFDELLDVSWELKNFAACPRRSHTWCFTGVKAMTSKGSWSNDPKWSVLYDILLIDGIAVRSGWNRFGIVLKVLDDCLEVADWLTESFATLTSGRMPLGRVDSVGVHLCGEILPCECSGPSSCALRRSVFHSVDTTPDPSKS